jgi:hypothetical protein
LGMIRHRCQRVLTGPQGRGYSGAGFLVATGSPQDESVQCADLWPVQLGAVFL